MARSVLIVDDSLTVRMDLGACFESAGFTVHLASSLSQAREILSGFALDGIVLDLRLPDGDGTDFLEQTSRTLDPQPPVLMLSSEARIEHRIRGLQAGADEYVGKPYDRDYVVVRLSELIQNRDASQGDECILLIDDSATVRKSVGDLLCQAGYQVLTAASGEEGLRLVTLHHPRLVIVDSQLPGIDGKEVVQRLRMDSVSRDIPCLMLTGSETQGSEIRVLDAGADAFLRKEEVAPLLLARVAAVLRSAGEPMRHQAKTFGPSRILAVDDSPTFLNLLAQSLVGEGYNLVRAASGEEALEMLAVQEVDCILLDLMLPGVGGEATCRRLKSMRQTQDIPLIILSALADQDSVLRGLAAGADDYVAKSDEFEVLRARIRSQLRRKQFQDEKRRHHAELLERELESAEAKAARELAQTRADLICQLEAKNRQLEEAYRELQTTQVQLVHSAKMASLGQLVAGLAHEINNPVAYVASNLDAVATWLRQLSPQIEDGLEASSREKWARIEKRIGSASQGVERVAELVRKLRTFSRLDEGEFKTVDLQETVESVLFFLEHRLSESIVIQRVNRCQQTHLDCYAGALNQVLMNLLVNAIDAIESEGESGVITITLDHDDAWFYVLVQDTGPGLAPDSEGKLFEPFFTTKPVGQGTGLGLSISFAIMQGHHGSISARNLPDGGCEFRLELPRDLAQRRKNSSADPPTKLLGTPETAWKSSSEP